MRGTKLEDKFVERKPQIGRRRDGEFLRTGGGRGYHADRERGHQQRQPPGYEPLKFH